MNETSTAGTVRSSSAGEGQSSPPEYLSLAEVMRTTGISMPTLLRYKREQPRRIPSTGSGSQQRFPPQAIAVFLEIHREETGAESGHGFGLMSLPRLRRAAARGGSDAEVAPVPLSEKRLLSLRDISEMTAIAYPTIARYAAQNIQKIPHVGTGRSRRFPQESVEVFRQIRRESRRGRPPKSRSAAALVAAADIAALEERIRLLEHSHAQLEANLRAVLAEIGRVDTAASQA